MALTTSGAMIRDGSEWDLVQTTITKTTTTPTTSPPLLDGEQRHADGTHEFRPNPGSFFDYRVTFCPKTKTVTAGGWSGNINTALYWLEQAPGCVGCWSGHCDGPCADLMAGQACLKAWSKY